MSKLGAAVAIIIIVTSVLMSLLWEPVAGVAVALIALYTYVGGKFATIESDIDQIRLNLEEHERVCSNVQSSQGDAVASHRRTLTAVNDRLAVIERRLNRGE